MYLSRKEHGEKDTSSQHLAGYLSRVLSHESAFILTAKRKDCEKGKCSKIDPSRIGLIH